MENIFLLPTDKPSRLWVNNLLQGKLELSKEILIGSNTAQHIYTTSNNDNDISDEGINHVAGSWVLNTITNKVYKTLVNIISGDDIQKIILTTDQDLIKDGVQAIDDEFLEWFVKNPTCKWIDVIIEKYVNLTSEPTPLYKIIIPNEENLEDLKKELKSELRKLLVLNSEIGNFGRPRQYKYVGECRGNNNGCFLDSAGHDCGCFTRVSIEDIVEEATEGRSNQEEWVNFFNNNSKEEILEYLTKYKFPL